MHVLVTGGAGFIGSVMVETLLEHGHAVTVYDNLSKGYRDAVHADAFFVEGDVGDRPHLESLLRERRIEAVIHMAAFIEVGESVREPRKYLDNNFLRAVELLEAMRAVGVQLFVLSSTAAVFAPVTGLLREDSPIRPASPYGLSKLFLEQTLAWYASLGLRYYALRYFNAAGATARCGERHQPESHLIPLVLQTAAGERPAIHIFGEDYNTTDGTCVRDYIHIRDLTEAHVLALNQLQQEMPPTLGRVPELAERAFNLGNGAGFSVREVIAAAERVCGHSVPVVVDPRRSGDVDRLVASSEKMHRLGWSPRCANLEEIVSTAWEWRQRRRSVGQA